MAIPGYRAEGAGWPDPAEGVAQAAPGPHPEEEEAAAEGVAQAGPGPHPEEVAWSSAAEGVAKERNRAAGVAQAGPGPHPEEEEVA